MFSKEEINKKLSQLWPQLIDGDADAIAAIITLVEVDLQKLAIKYLINDQDINAVLNDSFRKVFDNAKKIRNHDNLYGWIKTIVVNNCLTHIKKYKKEVSLEGLVEKHSAILSVPGEDIIEQIHIKNCLASLEKTERTILLFHSQDYTLQEICDLTNLTMKRVRNKLKKGKENFIKSYEKGKTDN